MGVKSVAETPEGGSVPVETSLIESVTDELKRKAVSLRSEEPARFPTERALSERLGVSRQTIRTALRRLTAHGILERRQGSGTYVLPITRLRQLWLLRGTNTRTDNPYYAALAATLLDHLGREGVALRELTIDHLPNQPTEDPLVITGLPSREVWEAVSGVFAHRIALSRSPLITESTRIESDLHFVGYDSIRRLVELGHRNLVHLTRLDRHWLAVERSRGFGDGARDMGATAQIVACQLNWSSGYAVADSLVRDHIRGGEATAVVAANDFMACGLLSRLHELGVGVPEEVSIIGYDDIPLAAELNPGLATYRENDELLVSLIVDHAKRMCLTRGYRHQRILVPPTYIERGSVGPGPAAGRTLKSAT